MNFFSSREAALRLGISRRRIQQIAKRDGIGRKVGNSLAFSAQDLARLRGKRPTKVFVEVSLEEGAHWNLRSRASLKGLSAEEFLSGILNKTFGDQDRQG